ncbi:MAG: hypothetical protein CVU99_01200 [Firmicutes bacterium HGW-Firmicutes-4]|jgi:hypothetical protein|nr:MAG: hypothetical protein CVU99_01200 [Firmicutes bacterium HGW-Firmicutes-4]
MSTESFEKVSAEKTAIIQSGIAEFSKNPLSMAWEKVVMHLSRMFSPRSQRMMLDMGIDMWTPQLLICKWGLSKRKIIPE